MTSQPTELSGPTLPPALALLQKPPEQAWLWGTLPEGLAVAVVGTRQPSEAGLKSTYTLVRGLAERGLVIVSGGALGIDSAAHEAALDAGGRTIVFAPAWLSHAYPSQNRPLFERVLERGGAYLSLSQAGRPTRHQDFYVRNEAMAAYARVLIVGQCGHQSGTKNAVKHARRLGREVFVVPSAYGDEQGIGSNALLAHGAKVVISSSSLLKEIHESSQGPSPSEVTSAEGKRRRRKGTSKGAAESGSLGAPPADTSELVSDDAVVLALIRGARTLDEIVTQAGRAVEEVQHRLLLLRLEGRVVEDGRGLLRYLPDR
jgi:DNA processing protein